MIEEARLSWNDFYVHEKRISLIVATKFGHDHLDGPDFLQI